MDLKNKISRFFIGLGRVDFDTLKIGSKGRLKVERVFETF